MTTQQHIDTLCNMILDNTKKDIYYPKTSICAFCGYAPVKLLRVSKYCPPVSYHCYQCKRSYWIPPERKTTQ